MDAGVHIIADFYGCPAELLEKVPVVLKLLNEVVKESGLPKVGETAFQFEPIGVTAVILLAESHISIHTWPEKNFASVDIFCSGKNNHKAFELMVKKFKVKNYKKKVESRGD